MPVLPKKGSSKVCGWICSVWPSCVWESQHASPGNSVSCSLGHSSRSSFHHMAFFSKFKTEFYCISFFWSPDCIFEIHQLWQSGFSKVYSNSCCSCWFEPEIINIGQSSYKMYSNNIVNSQESTTILNACTQKLGNLLKAPLIIFLVGFYSMSAIVGYLMPNPVFTYILNIWFVISFCRYIFKLACTKLNDSKYCHLIQIILFSINELFTHS